MTDKLSGPIGAYPDHLVFFRPDVTTVDIIWEIYQTASNGAIFYLDDVWLESIDTNTSMDISGGQMCETAEPGGGCVALYGAGHASKPSTIEFYGKHVDPPQALTTADDGAGTSPTETIIPTSAYVKLTYSDTNSCNAILSETDVQDGQTVEIINVGVSNTYTFTDTSGQMSTTSAAAFVASQGDMIAFRYSAALSAWVEQRRSDITP